MDSISRCLLVFWLLAIIVKFSDPGINLRKQNLILVIKEHIVMNNACFDDRDNTLSGVLGHIELFVLKISHRNSQGFLSWVPEEPYPYSLVIFSSLRLFFLFLDVKGQSFVGRTRSQEAVGAQTISIGIPRGFSAGSPRIVSPILATNSQVSDSPFR